MTDRLDDLLSAPLADVADDGFSARVMSRIGQERRRDEWITYAAIGVAALPALLFVPLPAIATEVSRLAPLLASAAPLAGAAALLTLTLSFEKLIQDRFS
ncbi:MAG TPA: hypothetical protein VLV55_05055 [Rhizomicrobium sp.]|nr:hypothetical protein [Rhizomicrobium sp.]